jgi:hypothetical protein
MLTDIRRVRKLERRRAVAGILAALILFAMLLTVGISYFLLINSSQQAADEAAATRQSSAHGLSQEQLSLTPVLSGSTITLDVANSGGVSSTIVAAYVTSQSGLIFSATDGKSYFTGTPDLTYSLPLSLNVGESTTQMAGCAAAGCNLVFQSYTYTSGTVLLSVLTQDGNVFSTQYPSSFLTTITDISGITSVLSTTETLSDIVTSSVTTYVTSDTTTISCYACTTTAVAGGNILVVTITASPSPVQTGQTITDSVTVWDYSAYQATGVTVTVGSEESGTGSVTATGGTCATSLTISAESSKSCTATYSADAGGGGGTAVFNAYAVGCIQTGTNVNCITGTTIQSATSTSNPVQIGNLVSVGPWALDFNYFDYTAVGHTTPSAAAIISGSDDYVGLQVNVTNTYNAPLTLLDYSYLQFISPGSDVNEFIVSSFSYSGTPSFTQYTCTDSPPSAPTGTCTTVQPGHSVILDFAASSYGTNSWDWSTSDPGGDNVGCTVQIILAYSLQSGTSYQIYAQNVPFQSVFIQ